MNYRNRWGLPKPINKKLLERYKQLEEKKLTKLLGLTNHPPKIPQKPVGA